MQGALTLGAAVLSTSATHHVTPSYMSCQPQLHVMSHSATCPVTEMDDAPAFLGVFIDLKGLSAGDAHDTTVQPLAVTGGTVSSIQLPSLWVFMDLKGRPGGVALDTAGQPQADTMSNASNLHTFTPSHLFAEAFVISSRAWLALVMCTRLTPATVTWPAGSHYEWP
jgi:hypothetical protein